MHTVRFFVEFVQFVWLLLMSRFDKGALGFVVSMELRWVFAVCFLVGFSSFCSFVVFLRTHLIQCTSMLCHVFLVGSLGLLFCCHVVLLEVEFEQRLIASVSVYV